MIGVSRRMRGIGVRRFVAKRALGKTCVTNRGPTKHRKGPLPTEKGLSDTEKDFMEKDMLLQLTNDF